MIDKRYREMPGFLGSQLLGYIDERLGVEMTVFEPTDDPEGLMRDDRTLMRYVAGCRLTRTELKGPAEGAEMRTFVDGYLIKIGRSGDIVLLNDVPVVYPDLLVNEWIVVHGLRGTFEDAAADAAQTPESGFVGDDVFCCCTWLSCY